MKRSQSTGSRSSLLAARRAGTLLRCRQRLVSLGRPSQTTEPSRGPDESPAHTRAPPVGSPTSHKAVFGFQWTSKTCMCTCRHVCMFPSDGFGNLRGHAPSSSSSLAFVSDDFLLNHLLLSTSRCTALKLQISPASSDLSQMLPTCLVKSNRT